MIYKYSPFAIFLFATLLFSCDPKAIKNDEKPIAAEEIQVSEKPDSLFSLNVKEFLDAPLTLSLISSDQWQTDTTLTPNVYDNSKTDTILFLRHKESYIMLHNQEFVEGTISNEEIKLVNNIRIGLPKDSFMKSFKDLTDHPDQPYIKMQDSKITMGCCSEMNELWEFEFNNDTLALIKYTNDLE